MENILEEIGDFTWIGFQLYFIETDKGNFVLDCMSNKLTRYGGSYFSYAESNNIMKVKFKGKHKIKELSGENVEVII